MKLVGFSLVFAVAAVSLLPAPPRPQTAAAPGPIQFSLSANFPTIGSFPSGIVSGDFNNDGIPDLAAVSSHAGYIAIALGNGDGTFGPWLDTLATYAPYVVAAGMLDGKNLDVVVGDLDFGDALALFGDGTGYFPTSTALSTNEHMPGGIVVGDFNGDGNNDVAITDTRGQGHVYLFLGNGDGTFQHGRKFTTGEHVPTKILAGDFNGDGKLDLAVLNTAGGASNGSVAILLGRGNGSFDAPLLYKFPHRPPNAPTAIAMGDFNGDGKLDIAVAIANYFPHTRGYVLLLLGNGDGTFTKGTLSNGGTTPDSIAAADFNGDGKLDLAVANSPGGANGAISILAGNGDGTFQPRVTVSSDGSEPGQIAVSDFNGDGKPDLAIVNAASSTVSVLLNTTVFPAHRPVPAKSHPRHP